MQCNPFNRSFGGNYKKKTIGSSIHNPTNQNLLALPSSCSSAIRTEASLFSVSFSAMELLRDSSWSMALLFSLSREPRTTRFGGMIFFPSKNKENRPFRSQIKINHRIEPPDPAYLLQRVSYTLEQRNSALKNHSLSKFKSTINGCQSR